jgi:hypothetical protein
VSFPILIENSEALGELHGKSIRASSLAATSLILASRGVDQVLIPTPSEADRLLAERGLLALPPERRSAVRLVDQNGEILRRVRQYLHPLVGYARDWPETAFVGFLENFVYYVALGARFKSAIAPNAVAAVREFIPIVNPSLFRGEAQFRLAELAALVCSYEPSALEQGTLRAEVNTGSSLAPRLWRLIETAEFREVIAESGKLGYVEHPIIAARHLQSTFKTYLESKGSSALLKSASTVVSLGTKAHPSLEIAKASADVLANFTESRESYRPPFLPLGPALQGIHRMALASISPDAVPVRDSIFAFARYAGGKESISWLNVGEEQKLEREAADTEGSRLRWKEAQKALARLF